MLPETHIWSNPGIDFWIILNGHADSTKWLQSHKLQGRTSVKPKFLNLCRRLCQNQSIFQETWDTRSHVLSSSPFIKSNKLTGSRFKSQHKLRFHTFSLKLYHNTNLLKQQKQFRPMCILNHTDSAYGDCSRLLILVFSCSVFVRKINNSVRRLLPVHSQFLAASTVDQISGYFL